MKPWREKKFYADKRSANWSVINKYIKSNNNIHVNYGTKIILFTETINKIKYLGIHSTVNVLALHEKNHKTSLRTKSCRYT